MNQQLITYRQNVFLIAFAIIALLTIAGCRHSPAGLSSHATIGATDRNSESAAPVLLPPPSTLSSRVTPPKARYHLSTQFVQRVSATLITTVKSSNTIDGELRIYAPVPPDLPTQRVIKCTVKCREYPNLVAIHTMDLNCPYQHLLCLHIPITRETLLSACTVEANYQIDLFKVSLVAGGGPDEAKSSNKPDASYSRALLSETPQADIKSVEFKNWLKGVSLLKSADETNLSFAHRVYRYLAQYGAIGPYLPVEKRKASLLCKSLAGDCGALSVLFTSVLRANGVQSVVFPGRWAMSEEPNYGQFYVISGVLEPGIGIIPVDQLKGIKASAKGTDPDRRFGSADGNYIVLNSCFELTPETGLVAPLHHYMVWARSGSSPFSPTWEDHWTVEKLK